MMKTRKFAKSMLSTRHMFCCIGAACFYIMATWAIETLSGRGAPLLAKGGIAQLVMLIVSGIICNLLPDDTDNRFLHFILNSILLLPFGGTFIIGYLTSWESIINFISALLALIYLYLCEASNDEKNTWTRVAALLFACVTTMAFFNCEELPRVREIMESRDKMALAITLLVAVATGPIEVTAEPKKHSKAVLLAMFATVLVSSTLIIITYRGKPDYMVLFSFPIAIFFNWCCHHNSRNDNAMTRVAIMVTAYALTESFYGQGVSDAITRHPNWSSCMVTALLFINITLIEYQGKMATE